MLKKILVAGLVVTFAIYLWTIRGQLTVAIDSLQLSTLATLVGILLTHWAVRALRDRILLKALGYSPTAHELFWVNCAQVTLNYLPFKAGTLSSAGYLKAQHAVRYRDFAVTFLQQYLLLLFSCCLIGLIALQAAPALPGVQARSAAILLMAVCLACAGMLAWDGFWKLLPRKIRDRLDNSSRGLHIFYEAPLAGTLALLLSLLMAFTAATRIWILFFALFQPISISGATLVSAAMQMSVLISFTPAGLGITEAAAGLSAKLAMMGIGAGVLVATVDRAVILVLSIILLALKGAGRLVFRGPSRAP